MIQNGNEALECYCGFLYCINGWFIPRKDWLVYLTTELEVKAPNHDELIDGLYRTEPTEVGVGKEVMICGNSGYGCGNTAGEKAGWELGDDGARRELLP